MSNSPAFEKLSPEDLPELKELSRSTFYEAFASDNNPDDLEAYLDATFGDENLRKELLNPLSEFYFARINGETVGYFKINLGDAQTEFQDENGMELERIYVKKEFQNKKIGQKMLGTVIEMAIQRKMKYLWLGVWEKNEKAIQFYLRNNFVLDGSHPYLVGNDLQTDKIMKLLLVE